MRMSLRRRAPTAAAILLIHTALVLLQPARAGGEDATPKASSPGEIPGKKAVECIDINRASADEFARLPGIGPELARRIVAYREKHGPFRRVEEMLVIKGVGHKKWRAIRPFLRVVSEAEIKPAEEPAEKAQRPRE
jgi:competence protein ComEA